MMLKSMDSANAMFLQELVTLWNTKAKLSGPMAWIDRGFGISDSQITSLGLNVADLLQQMQVKQWLWIDKTKPTRTMHPSEHQGKPVNWIIIKEAVARQIGFAEDER